MKPIFIEVDEHEELPDGCIMKFSALEDARPVSRIRYERSTGETIVCKVEGRAEGGSLIPAWRALVDDSSAGQAWLVGGGAWGVRVQPEQGDAGWVEPFLLLGPDAVVE